VPDDDRVAGVVPALVPDHVVHAVTEQVGRLALALVAPLGTDQNDGGHRASPPAQTYEAPAQHKRSRGSCVPRFPANPPPKPLTPARHNPLRPSPPAQTPAPRPPAARAP